MTKDEIIEMAREAGAGIGTSGRWLVTQDELERFAELVAAKERYARQEKSHPLQAQPMTENEMHQEIVALSERLFDARIGKSCSQCEGGTYQADHNGYSRFHRCNKCHYVPMWGEDGREFGATGEKK